MAELFCFAILSLTIESQIHDCNLKIAFMKLHSLNIKIDVKLTYYITFSSICQEEWSEKSLFFLYFFNIYQHIYNYIIFCRKCQHFRTKKDVKLQYYNTFFTICQEKRSKIFLFYSEFCLYTFNNVVGFLMKYLDKSTSI